MFSLIILKEVLDMLRFISKLIVCAINALMAIICIPFTFDKFLEMTKLSTNDNQAIKEVINFFTVFDKYKASEFINLWYIAVGIVCVSLLLEIISIFTRRLHIFNFLTGLVLFLAVIAFNFIYIFAKIKLA
jgi:hypothetical protein